GILASAFTLIAVFVGIFAGGLMAAAGPRRVMLTAIILAVIGSLVSLAGSSFATLLAGRTLEGLSLISIAVAGPTLLIQHTHSDNRGWVMGIWGGFMPLGNFLGVMAGPLLLGNFDWQGVWISSTLFAGLVGLLAFWMIPPDATPARLRFDYQSIGAALRLPVLVGIGICFGCHSLIFQVVLQFTPLFVQQQGGSLLLGALLISAFCLINFFGNSESGRMIQRGYKPINLILFTFLTIPVYIVMIFLPNSPPWLMMLGLLGLAIHTGLTPPSFFYLVGQIIRQPSQTPVFMAYMMQIQGLGMLIGPATLGWSVDRLGGWEGGFFVLGIPCLLASAIIYGPVRLWFIRLRAKAS
ncbi:MAG: MFS transporter, partial [Alphaproteobacteria bacterium]|nr:MFS transporter [Alphaproteobacteria bacterium]